MRIGRSARALIAVALLGSAQAVPASRDSTWQEIRSDRSLDVRPQTVEVAGVFVPVFDLCTRDGRIQAIDPEFQVCKDPALGEAVCERTTVHLSRPLSRQEWVCTKPLGHDGTCDDSGMELVTVMVATHWEVPVHEMNRSDPGGGRPLFTKPFDVPTCEAGGR